MRISDTRVAEIISDRPMDIRCVVGALDLRGSSSGVTLQNTANGPVILFENATSGENPSLRQAGYITNGANEVEVEWTVKDTDDYFWLERENTNILGFKIAMPVNLIDNKDR